MIRTVALALCLLLPASLAGAAEQAQQGEVKELSGMSIVGNDEAPKSLYIVPWKSSEIGMESDLRWMQDTANAPVDPEVFIRQLNYYEASKALQNERN